MIVKTMKMIIVTIVGTALIFTVLPGSNSAAETAQGTGIPDDLSAAKGKKRDPSLAISVKAVLYKLRQKHRITLVDVRSPKDFERLRIPGSINIRLYFIKTKSFLKSTPIVLVNGGFSYTQLLAECRRLEDMGFSVSILDGGITAWRLNAGALVGDLLALNDIRRLSSQQFYQESPYDNHLVIEISPIRSEISKQLLPQAVHLPDLADARIIPPNALKMIHTKSKRPFFSVVVISETGEGSAAIVKIMNRKKINAFYLNGGIISYQQYSENLALSWRPRDKRMQAAGSCSPCGKEKEQRSSPKNEN